MVESKATNGATSSRREGFFVQRVALVLTLAIRNLWSHRIKTIIVGTILAFGTFLVIVGTSLIDSIEHAMEESITQSVSGQFQIYSSEGRDELALFGSGFMGADDIGRIDRFEDIRRALSTIDNIKAVVPMGLDIASLTAPGELEGTLQLLRQAVRDSDTKSYGPLAAQIREIIEQMQTERESVHRISQNGSQATLEEELALLNRGLSSELWATFSDDPLPVLEFLDTKVAPLAEEGRLFYFRYLGTDLDLYAKHFDRIEVVHGTRVPPHSRGFMFNQRFYEEIVKNLVAVYLDKIDEERREEGKTIAASPDLQARIRRLKKQYRRITHQLDPSEQERLAVELEKMFPDVEGGLAERLVAFLDVDDETFDARYRFFYDFIAPMIQLYAFQPGDTITIRAYTRSGFLKAVNIELYGVFKFRGLEKSRLATAFCLTDLLTFRELYGLMTEQKQAELFELKREVGLREVSQGDAEDALFGSGNGLVETMNGADGFDEFARVETIEREAVPEALFDQAEIDKGLALNAAVVLEDPSRRVETRGAIEKALKAARLDMKVVGWQQAAGIVGQLIVVLRGVLYIGILIIFIVAMVIINNSMVMATLERTTEIGTMRAIGAQRYIVLEMFMLETLVLGLLAGMVGALVSTGLLSWLGVVGLTAPSPQLIFLFGGPKLFVDFGVGHVVAGFGVIILVSIASTLYPARLATRVEPITAMREKE